jgi:hypothetical protein
MFQLARYQQGGFLHVKEAPPQAKFLPTCPLLLLHVHCTQATAPIGQYSANSHPRQMMFGSFPFLSRPVSPPRQEQLGHSRMRQYE